MAVNGILLGALEINRQRVVDIWPQRSLSVAIRFGKTQGLLQEGSTHAPGEFQYKRKEHRARSSKCGFASQNHLFNVAPNDGLLAQLVFSDHCMPNLSEQLDFRFSPAQVTGDILT